MRDGKNEKSFILSLTKTETMVYYVSVAPETVRMLKNTL